jgi:hypothetical protein
MVGDKIGCETGIPNIRSEWENGTQSTAMEN